MLSKNHAVKVDRKKYSTKFFINFFAFPKIFTCIFLRRPKNKCNFASLHNTKKMA